MRKFGGKKIDKSWIGVTKIVLKYEPVDEHLKARVVSASNPIERAIETRITRNMTEKVKVFTRC